MQRNPTLTILHMGKLQQTLRSQKSQTNCQRLTSKNLRVEQIKFEIGGFQYDTFFFGPSWKFLTWIPLKYTESRMQYSSETRVIKYYKTCTPKFKTNHPKHYVSNSCMYGNLRYLKCHYLPWWVRVAYIEARPFLCHFGVPPTRSVPRLYLGRNKNSWHPFSHSANGPWDKSLNFNFPTKHVIPESLKFSHWLSEF